jgi:hypothetical protein
MSKFARCAVLVAALASLFAVLSSTAGAVTWHNTGSTAFTATGGPGTLAVGANNLACTASSGTATAPGGSTVATVYNMSFTFTWKPCSLAGQNTFLHCDLRLTGSLFSAGVTAGSLDLTCDAKLTASPTVGLCHFSGSVPVSFTNPFGATKGKVTLTASNTLVVSNYNTTSCPLGTGTGTVSEQTLNVTNGTPTTLGPVLNRTA